MRRYRKMHPSIRAWLSCNAAAWTAREIGDAAGVSQQAVLQHSVREGFALKLGSRAPRRCPATRSEHERRVETLATLFRGLIAQAPEVAAEARARRQDRTRSRSSAARRSHRYGSVLAEEAGLSRDTLRLASQPWIDPKGDGKLRSEVARTRARATP